MSTGNKIALWLIVIGLVIVALGFGVEAGGEVDVIDCYENIIVCNKGNRYMTVFIPITAMVGDTTSTATIRRSGSGVTFNIFTGTLNSSTFEFWIGDVDTVIIYRESEHPNYIVSRFRDR